MAYNLKIDCSKFYLFFRQKSKIYGAQNETYIEGWEKKGIKPIDIQKVVQNVSGWLCKTKRLRGFNLQLHLGAF